MKLNRGTLGEAAAVVGVVLGFVALWTALLDGAPGKYSKDGTITVAMIVLLGLAGCCLAASLLGTAKLDLAAAATGAVAFGFFLFVPAVAAFKNFDKLGTGAWLGVCTGLIPLGAGLAYSAGRGKSDAKAPNIDPASAVAAIGLVLIVAGIWMEIADKSGVTYWNASATGHALGLLTLLLAIASALLIVLAVRSQSGCLADLALIVACITAGLAMAEGIGDAFGSFGEMGSGAWMELFGGLALVAGLVATRMVKFAPMKKAAAPAKKASAPAKKSTKK